MASLDSVGKDPSSPSAATCPYRKGVRPSIFSEMSRARRAPPSLWHPGQGHECGGSIGSDSDQAAGHHACTIFWVAGPRVQKAGSSQAEASGWLWTPSRVCQRFKPWPATYQLPTLGGPPAVSAQAHESPTFTRAGPRSRVSQHFPRQPARGKRNTVLFMAERQEPGLEP